MQFDEIKKLADVSDSAIDKQVYAFDATEIEGKTSAVVWPESTDDVSKIMKLASRRGIPITVRGGGTSLAAGAVPDGGLVIDMSRMNRIIEIKGKLAIVEAGVVVYDLNEELKEHNLVFPVKPASHKVCHVGGAAATNAAGERAIRYGKMADWTDSVEVVFPSGKTMWTKAEPFVGSEGIYGIITKVKLKLTEPSQSRSISIFEFDNVDDLLKKVEEFRRSAMSIEFINKKASEIAGLGQSNKLLVEFEDNSGEITDKQEIESKWEQREGMGPVLTSAGYVVMEDPMIPKDRMFEFLKWLEQHDIPSFGHIAFGIVHPRFRRGSELVNEMFEFVQKIGGKVSGEHGIGLTKKRYLEEPSKKRIKALKKKYDPKNILNRGKVI